MHMTSVLNTQPAVVGRGDVAPFMQEVMHKKDRKRHQKK